MILVNDMTLKSENHKVTFPNWLYIPSKLFLHHKYGPLKTNMHPNVLRVLHFFIIPMIYETYTV